MLPKYLFYLAFGTFLLSGCGLETDEDSDEESDSVTSVQVEVEQNAYLPLTNATTLFYTANEASPGDIEGAVSYDVGMSNSKGYPVYKVALNGTDLKFDLYFRSTNNQIYLLGIDGPIELEGGDVIEELTFSPPIKLIGNLSDQSTSATLTGTLDGKTVEDAELPVVYTLTNTNQSFSEGNTAMPLLQTNVEASFTIPLVATPIEIAFDFSFTRGLGLVEHKGYLSDKTVPDYEIQFYDLDGLVNIMRFDQSGNIANGGSNTITVSRNGADIALSYEDYSIVNNSELAAYSWLAIENDVGTESFTTTVDISDVTYPDTLTSVQVLFESTQDGERLSGSIIVLED